MVLKNSFIILIIKGSVTGVFLDVFLIISEQVAEVYLEPSPTSTMEFFCENSWRVLAVNYCCKKAPS